MDAILQIRKILIKKERRRARLESRAVSKI
jgi:hypothetical protein